MLFQKNRKTGRRLGGEGIEDMQITGVLKKEHEKIPGVNSKRSGVFRDELFFPLEFPARISKRKVTNLNIPRFFLQKCPLVLNDYPCLDFFLEYNNPV